MSESKGLIEELNELQSLPSMEGAEDFFGAHERGVFGKAALTIKGLEFQSARLKGALQSIVHFEPNKNAWAVQVARQALERDHE